MTKLMYSGDRIGAFPVNNSQWKPNEDGKGYIRKFSNTSAIREEGILTDIQGGGSLRLLLYHDGGALQVVKDENGTSINKLIIVKKSGFAPKNEWYKYTKLNDEELGLSEKSMIQRSKEFIEGRISKKTFEKIKQLYTETQGFTKRFKWVKVL